MKLIEILRKQKIQYNTQQINKKKGKKNEHALRDFPEGFYCHDNS